MAQTASRCFRNMDREAPDDTMRQDKHYITVLTIAGSDSCGGAGIQADLKTIASLGCYGMSAITAITAQNTIGVTAIEGVSSQMVSEQIRTVCDDIRPAAIKTGMLFSRETVSVVAAELRKIHDIPVIVDPVMVSTSGSLLLRGENVVSHFASELFPVATLLTPNVHEARAFTGETDPLRQLEKIHRMGCRNVLVKGGDAPVMTDGHPYTVDFLSLDFGTKVIKFTVPTVATRNTHGTGCTLSSAIAAFMARGFTLEKAVEGGREYITSSLRAGADVATGDGHGPVNHFFNPIPQIMEINQDIWYESEIQQ